MKLTLTNLLVIKIYYREKEMWCIYFILDAYSYNGYKATRDI